jgi:hypothetical protein
VVSTIGPESRRVHETDHSYRDGFKACVAVEPNTGLITATDLTAWECRRRPSRPARAEERPGGEVIGDSAYGSGEFRAHLAKRKHTAAIKPIPILTAMPGGVSLDDFDIHEGTVTPGRCHRHDQPRRTARFGTHCITCPF